MTTSTTFSTTYTVVDIQRVVDCFAADYDMIAQSTGLCTQSHVDDVIEDIQAFAKHGYIIAVNIVLQDAFGNVVRAAKYTVSTDASMWTSDRPGNSLWPSTSSGDLSVVVNYSKKWRALSDESQAAFKSELNISWGPSSIDTSYPGLSGQFDRRYSSNAYGMEKHNYR